MSFSIQANHEGDNEHSDIVIDIDVLTLHERITAKVPAIVTGDILTVNAIVKDIVPVMANLTDIPTLLTRMAMHFVPIAVARPMEMTIKTNETVTMTMATIMAVMTTRILVQLQIQTPIPKLMILTTIITATMVTRMAMAVEMIAETPA